MLFLAPSWILGFLCEDFVYLLLKISGRTSWMWVGQLPRSVRRQRHSPQTEVEPKIRMWNTSPTWECKHRYPNFKSICPLPVLYNQPSINHSQSTQLHYIVMSVVHAPVSLGLNKPSRGRLRRIHLAIMMCGHMCTAMCIQCFNYLKWIRQG